MLKNVLTCLVSEQAGFSKFFLEKYFQEKLSIFKKDKSHLQQIVYAIPALTCPVFHALVDAFKRAKDIPQKIVQMYLKLYAHSLNTY